VASRSLCVSSILFFSSQAQPLPGGGAVGGGGGGGGSFGGYSSSSSSSHSDSGPICSRNCRSCSEAWTCDVCNSGYFRTEARQCVPCGLHCVNCNVAGPGHCDVCVVRYTAVNSQCHACAPHCWDCDEAGPGRCDECDSGYMVEQHSRECAQCAPHCKQCHNTTVSGCDACYWWYRLETDGSCVFNRLKALLIALIGLLTALAIMLCHFKREMSRRLRSRRATSIPPPSHEEYISSGLCRPLQSLMQDTSGPSVRIRDRRPTQSRDVEAAPEARRGLVRAREETDAALEPPQHRRRTSGQTGGEHAIDSTSLAHTDARLSLPSGIWRGYYTFAGARHDVCEFDLSFPDGTGQVTGSGVDDVGQYNIRGRHGGMRLAFSKTYVSGSRNIRGVVSYGNKGHTVEYRGEFAGSSLGSGFRGLWMIRSSHGDHNGQFHLWPAMPGFSDPDGNSPQDAGRGPGSTSRTFEESECVVCYDRTISTRLQPCGHVALCSICAYRLNPRKCPLCRSEISAIEAHSSSASTAGS